MSEEAPEFWDTRYQSAKTPWDLGEANPMLVRWLQEHPEVRGRAVVVGCGRGHDALALAEHGWEVTGIDFAPSAIAEALSLSASADLDVDFRVADLFALDADLLGAFDLVFEHTCFCAIPTSRRRDYVEAVSSLLVPGGLFLGVFYTEEGAGGPPYGVASEEIADLFSSAFDLRALAPVTLASPKALGQEHFGEFVRR